MITCNILITSTSLGKIQLSNLSIQLSYQLIKKIDKKIQMGNIIRKNFIVDEQRITSIELDKTKPESCNSFTIRSQLFAYFSNETIMNEWYKELKSITRAVHFTALTKRDKNNYIRFRINISIQ